MQDRTPRDRGHRTISEAEDGRSATVSVRKLGDTVVLDIGEQLIVRSRQQLKDVVLSEIERGERNFVIDFGRTGYIDSSGLGVLISISKQLEAEGGKLALTNLNEDLRTLFELTKLDTLFRIIDGAVVVPPPRNRPHA
jgi:anti-sigma B factor antagonist